MTRTILITGAARGLGLETARRLNALGHTVIIGARDARRGAEAAARLSVRSVQLDVDDDDSVRAAAADVAAHVGRLDVLINNAGIVGSTAADESLDAAAAHTVFSTNVFGIVRTTSAFLPLLRASGAPAVVNVTSGAGSLALASDPSRAEFSVLAPLYASSKAAVTVLTAQYAKAHPEVRFNAADPGHTATDLNGHSGAQTVTEGTDAIVTLATEPAEAGTGRVIDRFGAITW